MTLCDTLSYIEIRNAFAPSVGYEIFFDVFSIITGPPRKCFVNNYIECVFVLLLFDIQCSYYFI